MGFFVEEVQQLEPVLDLDLDHSHEYHHLNMAAESRQVDTQGNFRFLVEQQEEELY
jgi:hypothetical protein